MTIERRVWELIKGIESSSLPDSAKQDIYQTIRSSFRSIAITALAKHLKQGEIEALLKQTAINHATYLNMLTTAVNSTPIHSETTREFHAILDAVESELNKHIQSTPQTK